jgi:hypothetical protein
MLGMCKAHPDRQTRSDESQNTKVLYAKLFQVISFDFGQEVEA